MWGSLGAHDGVSVFSQVGVSGSDLSSFIRMQIDSRTFKCGLHCAYLEYPFTSSSLLVCIAIAITVFTSHYYTHSLQVSHLPLQPLSVPPFPSFLFPRFRFFLIFITRLSFLFSFPRSFPPILHFSWLLFSALHSQHYTYRITQNTCPYGSEVKKYK